MRAGNARPYELQSVPTKTVAVRSTGNCSDLVQNLCLHPCLPLEGKVSAKPTDEVKFKSVRSAHTSIIHYSLFTIHLQAQSALPGKRNKCTGKALMRY